MRYLPLVAKLRPRHDQLLQLITAYRDTYLRIVVVGSDLQVVERHRDQRRAEACKPADRDHRMEFVVFGGADGDVFEAATPPPLFAPGVALTGAGEVPDYLYDVTPDGERFLINEPLPTSSDAAVAAAAPRTEPLKVIVNWNVGLAPQ